MAGLTQPCGCISRSIHPVSISLNSHPWCLSQPQPHNRHQYLTPHRKIKKNNKKNPGKTPSGDSTGPVSAEGGQQRLDPAPGSCCNFQQGHEVPLQCRALLPRRSCPRRGLFSGPFPCGFGPSCSLCASLNAENGVPLLESVLSILITCELEGTPPPYLGRVASEYMGRKSKIY